MKRLVIAVVLVATVAVSACTPWRDDAAARVDGVDISAKDLENDARELLKQPQLADAYLNTSVSFTGGSANSGRLPTSLLSVLLNRRVSDVLVGRELAARGVALTDADRTEAEQNLNASLQRQQQSATATGQSSNLVDAFGKLPADLRARLLTAEAASNRLRHELSAKELSAFASDSSAWYDSHRDLFQQYCLSVIPVKDQAEAQALAPQVNQGTLKDIVAAQKGQDAGCGLGYQVQQSLPADLSAAVLKAEPGQALGPFSANDGSQVLVAISSRQQQAYNDVKAAADALYQQDRLSAEDGPWSTWLAAQKPRVSVDPRYGNWDPAKLAVVAPQPATGPSVTAGSLTGAPSTTAGSRP
ncbi:MAG: hypothetical protein QOJ19_2115 [Acidimicrobiia bacterium]|nr:hypothetical protein [Acidimicrobiia bacterium]